MQELLGLEVSYTVDIFCRVNCLLQGRCPRVSLGISAFDGNHWVHKTQDCMDGWLIIVDQCLQLRHNAASTYPDSTSIFCRRDWVWSHHTGTFRSSRLEVWIFLNIMLEPHGSLLWIVSDAINSQGLKHLCAWWLLLMTQGALNVVSRFKFL